MSDTPRTDALDDSDEVASPYAYITMRTFARQLERELSEAQEQCRALAASNLEWIKANGPNGWIENLRSELAAERIKREAAERRLAGALLSAKRFQWRDAPQD